MSNSPEVLNFLGVVNLGGNETKLVGYPSKNSKTFNRKQLKQVKSVGKQLASMHLKNGEKGKQIITKGRLKFCFYKTSRNVVTFAVVTSQHAKIRIIYDLLDEVENQNFIFTSKKGIKKELKGLFEKYNKIKDTIIISNEKIEDIKETMGKNIKTILDYGSLDTVDALDSNAQKLEEQAVVFQKKAKIIKRKADCRLCLLISFLVAIVVLVCLIVVGFIGAITLFILLYFFVFQNQPSQLSLKIWHQIVK